jgi:hypothetical protein
VNWQTNWTKPQRNLARRSDKTLFALGIDGAGGRCEQTGLMEPRRASVLFLFAQAMCRGDTPEEALAFALGALRDPNFEPEPAPGRRHPEPHYRDTWRAAHPGVRTDWPLIGEEARRAWREEIDRDEDQEAGHAD